MSYDVVIEGGLYFDGTGAPGVERHIGIRDGKIAAVSDAPLPRGGARVIDARGKWITPGFIDMHTHYDAELIAAPRLGESLRHGVTTVAVGSCSISTILSEPEDCSDLFTRVEAIPREVVLPLLEEQKNWKSPSEYVDFLRSHPLGPNVCAFLGHSDLRTRVLGLSRAVDGKVRPTEAELTEMERLLEDALAVGMIGLSSMTNPWDKLDGDRHRSAALPSTYATWGEYRRLNRVLRSWGRILQSAPNLVTPLNTLLFLLESASLVARGKGARERLKTTLITLADSRSIPGLHRVVSAVTGFFNKVLGADMRWQTLPVPFEVYADGIDLVVFEEFGAGEEALHLAKEVERNALLKDEAYRRRFRKDYDTKYSPRVWNRNFHQAYVVKCPDQSLEGKSFGEIANERGLHPVDLFLDLVVQYGKKLRWKMLIANHRPSEIGRMMDDPSALIGFADSGAHIRNMAFYSFPLRMLRFVKEGAHARGMGVERAVHRLTGEIGAWLGIDAGRIRVGDRADVCVIDPAALDARLDDYHEAPMDRMGDLMRMVNRSDGAVCAVLVNGRVAFDESGFADAVGKERGYGQYLPALDTPVVEPRASQPRPPSDAREGEGKQRQAARGSASAP